MPMDSSAKPEVTGQRRQPAEAGPGQFGVTGRPDRHQTPDVEVRAVAGRPPAPVPRSAGQPCLPASPVTFDLDQDRGAGLAAGDRLARRRPVDACHRCDVRAERRDLVALHRTEEVPAHPGRGGGRLGDQFLGVVLADVGQAGPDRGRDRLGAEPLGHRHDRDCARDRRPPLPTGGERRRDWRPRCRHRCRRDRVGRLAARYRRVTAATPPWPGAARSARARHDQWSGEQAVQTPLSHDEGRPRTARGRP